MDIVEIAAQFVAVMTALLIVSGAVTELIDVMKPLFLDPFDSVLPASFRTPIIYVVRFLAALGFLSSAAQIEEIRNLAPVLDPVDNMIVVVILSLFVALGSEFIYRLQQGGQGIVDAGDSIRGSIDVEVQADNSKRLQAMKTVR